MSSRSACLLAWSVLNWMIITFITLFETFQTEAMDRKQSTSAPTSASAVARPKTLTERPLDVLYLAYFAIHLVASIAIDAQLTFPPHSQRLFPEPLRKVLQDYLTSSQDPFLLAAAAKSADHVWFRVLLASETVFQIPCFVVAIWGLLTGEYRLSFLCEIGNRVGRDWTDKLCSLAPLGYRRSGTVGYR